MTGTAAIRLSEISKRYGAARALDNASITLRRGSVHALLGENGAGKTTLMRVAFGLVQPDTGEITVNDRRCLIPDPAAASAAGIGMVQQHFSNVGAMTVAENVALGGHGLLDLTATAALVRQTGTRSGVLLHPDSRVHDLSLSQQQRLEILKALSRNVSILILDEPTAILAPSEAADLFTWLRAFAANGGAVVVVTHKLTDALTHCDDVTVLRAGRTVHSGTTAEASVESLTVLMVGESLPVAPRTQAPNADGEPRVVARDLSLRGGNGGIAIEGASFVARAGEIVGVAGIEGDGPRTLMRALAGRVRPAHGTLVLPETIGFIPEDRHREGLALALSLEDNIALHGAGTRRGVLRRSRLRQRSTELLGRFDIRGGSPTSSAAALSGGNQQKLVLARELADAPQLIVAENPTLGLDIRAAGAVRERLLRAAREGATVIVYAGDLDEVLDLSSRILVVRGRTVLESPADRQMIGTAMLGA